MKIVGVLRGGTWENYEKSLNEGGKIISHIFENLSGKWKPIDILIDKNGSWHLGGLPIKPAQLMNKVDVVWNISHPSYSKTLLDFSIPNIEANLFSKSLVSREILKEHMKKIGINMPRAFVIPVYQKDFDGPLEKYVIKKAKEVFEKFSSPWIVKPLIEDLNIGIHIAKTFPELIDAIVDCTKHQKSILVEEFIFGKNVSVHSVAGFRGENVYNFPPIENKNGIIISPGKFSSIEKEKLINLVKKIYHHTNTSQYLKSDFVLHPSGSVYLTHIEFSPNLDQDSCFYKSCESVGTGAHHIIEHILERALN
jgi:D-alanine-D-alanine ligase-like ATP-grasp enzyme